ncbi:MAG: helix-turn-helix domain-containing protein, partial [Bacteroidales bacterium]|nr:helix-turn-helix domain-containing protein [Bacteroidales bacterium]
MKKLYTVRLSDTEREECRAVIEKSKEASSKVRRAHILLKADADWTDKQIADTFSCTRQCVENLRKRFTTAGFEVALHGKKRQTPPRPRILDDEQEAKLIALRRSTPPDGHY